MLIAIRIALVSLLLCLPARAQEIEVGSTLACDTQQQVERFVAVFRGDAEGAAKRVNTEVMDATACAVVSVVYVRGPEVAVVNETGRTYHIVRILVLGVLTPAGVQPAMPAAFFSYVPQDERAA
ncbi:MAG: hypothetical protein ACK4UO_02025 [Pseudolabrys sp.]